MCTDLNFSLNAMSCSQVYADFAAHLGKLAAAIHPLLDAPPVDIPGATTGSFTKRLAAVKTAVPLVKCGAFIYAELKNK